ncbi:hypothetical protein GCM10023083_46120 [Streptomyces phyllanthi]
MGGTESRLRGRDGIPAWVKGAAPRRGARERSPRRVRGAAPRRGPGYSPQAGGRGRSLDAEARALP